MTAEEQYRNLVYKTLYQGKPVFNKRTGSNVLTVVEQTLTYEVWDFPLLTSRKINWKGAIAELLGYLKGFTNTQQFNQLGTKTWDANANNPQWINSDYCLHSGDLGLIYGAVVRNTPMLDRQFNFLGSKDMLLDVCHRLFNHEDDRGLILSFWNESLQHLGCLRPCMYEHQFSIVNGYLNLHSTQRSADLGLGVPYNMIQCYALLKLMCAFTGLKFGKVYHRMINCHIYENQIEPMKELLESPLSGKPSLILNIPNFASAKHFINWIDSQYCNTDCFTVENYQPSKSIKIPFTV